MNSPSSTTITVIGLGNMGQALARACCAAGHRVTGWNRTSRDFRSLETQGMTLAASAAQACESAEIVLLVSLDYASTRESLADAAGSLDGRTVLQCCSGLREEATGFAEWVQERGARTLDVAIMGYPSDIGSERVMFLHAGPRELFEQWQPVLTALGPRHRHVGTDPGLAKTFDAVLLARSYAWMMGYLQSAAIARAAGLDIDEFTDIAMSLLGPLFANIERARAEIAASTFGPAREASLAVHHKALAGVLELAHATGARTPLLEQVHAAMAGALARGDGDKEIAACFRGFEANDPPGTS